MGPLNSRTLRHRLQRSAPSTVGLGASCNWRCTKMVSKRDDDRDGERDPHAGDDAVTIDEHSAEERRDHDRECV